MPKIASPVGAYEISVQAAGFKTFVRTKVTVNAATRATVDEALEIGSTPAATGAEQSLMERGRHCDERSSAAAV